VHRRVSSRSIVGREDELHALDRLLADAADGHPALLVLTGEAGIGKSRLARELEERARRSGFLVLHGESVELGGEAFPYAPVADALRDLPLGWAASALAGATVEARSALATLLPDVEREPGPDGPDAHGRRCLLVAGLLAQLAEEQPVLIVLEDLHWADRSSSDVVAYLARSLRSVPVACAMTVRTGELPASDPLRRLLAELERRPAATTLRLGALSREQVALQLEAIAGEPVAATLPGELHARAGGNPFLVEELFAAQRSGAGAAIPATLAEATLLRVESLSPEAQRVLALLAVAGGRLSHDVLARLDATGPALRVLLDAGIAVRDRDDRGVVLRHGLTGEVVAAHLLPGERAALHREIACVLAGMPGVPAAQLAEHWSAAGERPEALAASIAAGNEARQMAAYAEALPHFERAIALWDAAEAGSLPLDRAGLLGRAAEAARFSGDSARAIVHGRAALGAIDPAADPARAARLLERLGEAHFWDDAAALELYDAALEMLPPGPSAERARLLAAQAHALMGLRHWEEARRRCETVLAMDGAGGVREAAASALTTLGLVLGFLGGPDDGEAALRRALDLARADGSAGAVARAYINLGELLRLRGDRAGALRAMTDGEAEAARAGLGGAFGRFMAVNGAEDLLRLGRWDEAAARLHGEPSGRTIEAMRRGTLAQLEALRGATAAAGEHLEHALAAADGLPSEFVTPARTAGATLAIVAGDPAAARPHVDAGLGATTAREPLYTPPLLTTGLQAEADLAALARAHRRDADAGIAIGRAEQLAAELDAIATEFARGAREVLAHRDLGHAELARARGEADAAGWIAVAERFDALAEPHTAAVARLRAAGALLAASRGRREAGDLLGRVLATAAALGAQPLRREAETLATRARLDVAAPDAGESRDGDGDGAGGDGLPAGLTAREAEVLALLAAGLTNRAIGRELFISEKTVGTHVEHIFGKLDAHTRVEAATRAQLLGLAPAPRGS
jgi:DNA-binding CsgD family transcriptional regulator